MEVPCCGGLSRLAENAAEDAGLTLDLKKTVVDVRGKAIKEETLRYRFPNA
jgi:hypothetical protein